MRDGGTNVLWGWFLITNSRKGLRVGGGGRNAISHISFYLFLSFFFYLLGGSASPPLASRWYLWPPCWFSPKQSIKQIDPVHIVCNTVARLNARNFVLFPRYIFFFVGGPTARGRQDLFSLRGSRSKFARTKEGAKRGEIDKRRRWRETVKFTRFGNAIFACILCEKKPYDRENKMHFTACPWNTWPVNGSSRRQIANSNHTNCAKRRVLKMKEKKKKKKSYPVEAVALIVCQRNVAVLLAEITRPRDTGGCLRSCCNESFRSAIKFNSQSEIRVKVAS